jgi:hypothetical protein
MVTLVVETFQRLLLTFTHLITFVSLFQNLIYKDFLHTNAPTKTLGPTLLAGEQERIGVKAVGAWGLLIASKGHQIRETIELLVSNQLDAQFFFFICLFQFSTCFEQLRAHHQENQLYQYNIVTCHSV